MSFYDDFAESFSNKRRNPWNAFVNFIKSLEIEEKFRINSQKGVWCDLGAGNGRHLPILTKYTNKYVGTDISFQLLRIARDRNDPQKLHNWVACDVNALPFRKKIFQSIVSVAVFHHILKKNQLRQVLKTITRLLKTNGILILTLWGCFKGKNESSLKRKNFHRRMSNLNIFDSISTSNRYLLGVNDVLIPWTETTKGNIPKKKPRIYHLYTFNELNIYSELFELVKKESLHMGLNPGINYFLCLAMK
ncbi:MAG: class I SAM-dependent methyltransferase [Promethearchaeota archaeon]